MTGAAELGHAPRIRELLAQAGAAGTTSTDMAPMLGIKPSSLCGVLTKLVARGEAQTLSHKHARMYWPMGVEITAQAVHLLASRIDRRLSDRSITVARVKHQGRAANVLVTPPPAHAVPVRVKDHGRVRPEGEADFSRARHTDCPVPAFTARHQFIQLEPDNRWPSFASIPLGATLSPTHQPEAA